MKMSHVRGDNERRPKSRRRAVLAFAAATAALSLALTGCAAAEPTPEAKAPTIKLQLSHTLPEANPVHTATVALAKRIDERTNGTVKIEVFPAGTIGSTAETTEQASLGQPIISYVDASHISEYGVSELAMLASPFLLKDYDDADRILKSDLYAEWSDQLVKKSDLKILSLNWFAGARHIVGKKPVPEPSDLEGVKIRIPQARAWEIIFGDLLPSTPVAIASAEQYSAFQQGVVDAGEIPLKSIVDLGFNEVATDITLTGHLNLFLGYVMPASIFDKMTKEQQKIVLEEFVKGGVETTEGTTALDQDSRKLMESAGIKFHKADIKAYRAATAGYFAKFPDWSTKTVDRLIAIRDGK